MSGISIDSFHLDFSQIDACEILSTSAISIRKTASIRIYRCQGEHCCCRDTSTNYETSKTAESTKMLAILVPHSFTTGIVNVAGDHKLNNDVDSFYSLQKLKDAEVELRKSIHPCLVEEENDGDTIVYVKEIITSTNLPADVVLLAQNRNDSNRCSEDIMFHYSNLLNHDTASSAPWSVIKAFPVSILSNNNNDSVGHDNQISAIPSCPVCLNRIDPFKLGLPSLKPKHTCSQYCSSNLHHESGGHNIDGELHSCRNEILFVPWSPPSYCIICHIISQKDSLPDNHTWQRQSSLTLSPRPSTAATSSALQMQQSEDDAADVSLMCHDCGMTSTLWVCLTCGYIGCGRYTRKHAAQHYNVELHPFSLELATGRIWDYGSGTFAHRKDLMECPVLSMKWGNSDSLIRRQGSDYSSSSLVASSFIDRSDSYQGTNSSLTRTAEHHTHWKGEESFGEFKCDSYDDADVSCHGQRNATSLAPKPSPPPKKSTMISLEYEALLQSALEDQSQHYEGEISRLQAELAASHLQETQISDREAREIEALQKDCERLNVEVDKLSSVLLELQTEEAKHRATSQKLLREQTVSKDLLEKIRVDTTKLIESSDEMYEDLQLQISDLTANIRMMQQIAVDEELSQAQIFGTTGGVKESKTRGKKSRRNNKKR
jgi:hypothetical protein